MRERGFIVLMTALLIGLGVLAVLRSDLPSAFGQETKSQEAAKDVPRKTEVSEGTAGIDARRSWEVVSSRVNMGVEKGRLLLYNVHTGESYFYHNNADRWVALPFVEGEPGAAADSSRYHLKRFSRTGPTYLPFSVVVQAARTPAAERELNKKQGAAKPEAKK